ncbi:cell division protein DivIVA [Aneurinibacillus migulanus]|uniref:Cell division protein DivIVA n=1 Tax=Aneurinibacillus migulanus TaxID=47500 RepID=A0A0D1Y0U6_ANEMI|nr:DUF2203 domain-containing protein [Aneurinibacillus migulanus]KIV56839.1 cell division protein DivIVA [Aneurinibacillus migulanus]KIV60086.1 cell division protein DivIVA [Aneurinibacillus migulanus]KON96797.1 cell division protein DivIVA [Aneurinibacillus migulanus]KPD08568.1 cell division protein DivIVA [Aneurinibacillus migulanus]MED0893566.1 DUF2203 domain-containing protein [Aneurinibacillus migulanus]
MQKRFFTVEEANELLPSIRQEIATLQHIRNEFRQKYLELTTYKKRHPQQVAINTQDEYVFKMEAGLEFLEMQAQMHVTNIRSQGAQLKEIDPGLVDFPALINDEEVLLCWREGEEKITHYHGLHDGFAGRRKLE